MMNDNCDEKQEKITTRRKQNKWEKKKTRKIPGRKEQCSVGAVKAMTDEECGRRAEEEKRVEKRSGSSRTKRPIVSSIKFSVRNFIIKWSAPIYFILIGKSFWVLCRCWCRYNGYNGIQAPFRYYLCIDWWNCVEQQRE